MILRQPADPFWHIMSPEGMAARCDAEGALPPKEREAPLLGHRRCHVSHYPLRPLFPLAFLSGKVLRLQSVLGNCVPRT